MNILGILRHGPTAWNSDKRIQGVCDLPLDTGAFKIEPWQRLLARYGPWDHVVSSSLRRCTETCRLLLPGQPYEIDEGLREQDWGEWTGRTLKQIGANSPGSIEAQERLGWDFSPPGGEGRRQVLDRVRKAIHRASDNRDGQRILFITHLGVIKILLNHLENTPFLPDHSSPVAKRALHLLGQDGPKLTILQANIESP
jgi:probable phosphoglycerate mutase